MRARTACCLILVFVSCFCLPADAQELENLTQRLMATPIRQLADDAVRFGDPARGAMAFYQPVMNCAKCHVAGETGRRLGPDLSEKRVVATAQLIEAVLQPSALIKEGFESVAVQTIDGDLITGVLADETDSYLLVDQIEQPEKPLKIAKQDIDDWKKTKLSSMPEGLANQLADRQQFLDLISYLAEIANGGPERASELKPAESLFAVPPLPEYESRVDHAGLIKSLGRDALNRGAETFRLRCASCHGTLEGEGSMPTSLRFATGKFKHGNDPFTMYQTLTHGYGMMNPQRWMVPQQKYEVIHYIREHFLKKHNRPELFEVTEEYLAGLPAGDTRGPKPVISRPWTKMDYGHSLMNTIEVSRDGSNIAQKGIVVRLDDGPGGVESGSHWIMYEHDTMRVAGAWSGGFIDYNGIHFNGVHNRHPRVNGDVHFQNLTGPGWGRPADASFTDNRVLGRDNKRYGPLDRSWAHYQGMYRYGRQTIIKYTVGQTGILESPRLAFADGQPVFIRNLNLSAREQPLVLQIASLGSDQLSLKASSNVAVVLPPRPTSEPSTGATEGLEFDGQTFAQVERGDAFNMTDADFTIACRIKTKSDGTIVCQTKDQSEWIADGKSLFVRGGRLNYDIGWVGVVRSNRRIDDNQWHDIVMTWNAESKRVEFFVDGAAAGGGELAPKSKLIDPVVRIGMTNNNFPGDSFFNGSISKLSFYQRLLNPNEIADPPSREKSQLIGSWSSRMPSRLIDSSGNRHDGQISQGARQKKTTVGLLAKVEGDLGNLQWHVSDDGNLRLTIPAGPAVNFSLFQASVSSQDQAVAIEAGIGSSAKSIDLEPLTRGGPPSYPQTLETEILRGPTDGPFSVDVFTRPKDNPWNDRMRLTGVDFLPDPDRAVVCAWDGSVWLVSGIQSSGPNGTITWKRIAAGLFQPLGIKFHRGNIYVTCRDQLAVLHDLNGDGEIDWYQNFNSDHQVTEHFHEFAMGLQVDDEGNFYYAKSARHALPALVPHHGTLLKISPDGSGTEILANGFRAANGVCLNPDGSFVVTDQEGHWNPKNRINWVRPGGFYGNMFGYHDVTDSSDEAMDPPLCWITNSFDRSPSELLWVDSEKWGPLKGSLLNFSYGFGKVYVVPHEEVGGQMQGGMCEFPLERFPTGVMRGRFHPADGQLYCCGMFAWAGDQHQPGGFYRINYTGNPVHLPIGLNARKNGIKISYSEKVDAAAASDPRNYSVQTWDLKRTRNYGSKHYNQKRLKVEKVIVADSGTSVFLEIPEIEPTWGMEITYSIQTVDGQKLQGRIHNTIHQLGDQ